MQQISIHIIRPSDLLQPSLYNLPPKSLCFCDSICSLLYRKIRSYFKCLKEGKKDGKRARDVCVCVISIPRRGFILQNVSSTWSRLSAGTQHDGIDTGLPGGRATVSERSVSNKTLLSSSPSASDTVTWAQNPRGDALNDRDPNVHGLPHVSVCRKILLPVRDFWRYWN